MSFKNFSIRERVNKDVDYNDKYDKHETKRKTNEDSIGQIKTNKDKWKMLISYFRSYPDMFLEFMTDGDGGIDLYFYQRIYLRILCRYKNVFITATRGTSKSYLQNLAFIIRCILYPRNKFFVCASGKAQAARITQEKIADIFLHFPALEKEVKTYTKTNDYTELIFYNGSIYNVVTMSNATRGGRRYGGAIEEICDEKFDEQILNSVVLPLMANDRQAMCRKVDKSDPLHKSQTYITTASPRQHFAYSKAKEIYDQMLDGESAFFIGNSYELPCMHDLLDIDFVMSLKDSPTYSTLDFMREYESVYTGSSADALVGIDVLKKCRNLDVCELLAPEELDNKTMYVLSYDVARNEGDANAMSALVVIKCTPKNNGTYLKEVVNVFSLEGMHDTYQAKWLKQKVEEFKASILVVDANGLGSGVVDQLVLDLGDGYPPYKVVNDEEYERYYTEDSIPMVFALKAQNKETKNSDMINHLYKVFNKKGLSLLVSPQDGFKSYCKKHKIKVSDIDSEEKMKIQMPYIYTDLLQDELLNLRYKQSGNGQSNIERISSGINKDKYSALLYGLYWIYLEERKLMERKRGKKLNASSQSLVLRTPTLRKR